MTRRLLIPAAIVVAALLLAAPARAAWIWPVRGEVITHYRNGDDPYAAGQHRGIDIAAAVGTPVVAAARGEVRFAGTAGSSGVTVGIRTADGLYDTSYLHLAEVSVRKGQAVAAGERVGAVGTSGVRSAERPHLHFGVRAAGTDHAYRDPLAFLSPPSTVPEPPRPAPTPSPEPVPLAPNPMPAPNSRPAPRHAPLPRGAPAPVPRGAPVPVPRALAAPRGAPIPGSGPREAPAPHILPGAAPIPHRQPQRGPHGAGPQAPVPQGQPGGGPVGAIDARDRSTGRSAPAGPDLGWALACLGLLAAAALLGLSEDGRKATRAASRKGRRAIAALVSPRPGGP